MGALFSAFGRFWKSLSGGLRAAVIAGGALLFGLLTWVLEQLAGNAVSDWVNKWLVREVGPIAPMVWKVIATHLLSFVAAVGLVWIALSGGYWLGVRYPVVPVEPKPPEDTEKKRRSALNAVREIQEKLEAVERIANREFGDRDALRIKLLDQYRPEIQANLIVLYEAGLTRPFLTKLNALEAGALKAYVDEIEPYLAKGLYSQAMGRAADMPVSIDAFLKEHEPKKN